MLLYKNMKKLVSLLVVLLVGFGLFAVSGLGIHKNYTFSTFFQPHNDDPVVPLNVSLNKDDHEIKRIKIGQVEIQNTSFLPKYYRGDDQLIMCFSKNTSPFSVKFDQQVNRTDTGYFIVDGGMAPYGKMTRTMYFEYTPSKLDQSEFSSVSRAVVLENSTNCASMDTQQSLHSFEVNANTNKIIGSSSNTNPSAQNIVSENISNSFSFVSSFPVARKANFIYWSEESLGELKITNTTPAKKGVVLSFIFACLDNNNLKDPFFLTYIDQDKRKMPYGSPIVTVGTTIFPIHILDSSEYIKTFSTIFKDTAYADLNGIAGVILNNQGNLRFSVYISNKLPQVTSQPNCLAVDTNVFKKVGETKIDMQ